MKKEIQPNQIGNLKNNITRTKLKMRPSSSSSSKVKTKCKPPLKKTWLAAMPGA